MHEVDGLSIDTVTGESEKFTAAIVLIHGLWTSAAVWRRSMGFLAHRGWSCHALTLPRSDAALDQSLIEAYESAVRRVAASFDSPPVLVGHDLGAWIALRCRAISTATVAIAPVVPASISTEHLPFGPRLWRWFPRRHDELVAAPQSRAGNSFFGGAIPGGAVAEPRSLIDRLSTNDWGVPERSHVPALVVGGTLDRITPIDAARHLAQRVAADFVAVEAPHAMIWLPGWEHRVGEVHRWLIHMLGEPLLVPPDEEE